jgi:hypothetical protein
MIQNIKNNQITAKISSSHQECLLNRGTRHQSAYQGIQVLTLQEDIQEVQVGFRLVILEQLLELEELLVMVQALVLAMVPEMVQVTELALE